MSWKDYELDLEYDSDNETEKASRMWRIFVKIPSILFALSIIGVFILRIVIMVDVFQILCNTNTRFGAWLIWMLVGTASSSISYFVMRLSMCPIVLIVEYLKKISEEK